MIDAATTVKAASSRMLGFLLGLLLEYLAGLGCIAVLTLRQAREINIACMLIWLIPQKRKGGGDDEGWSIILTSSCMHDVLLYRPSLSALRRLLGQGTVS